MTRHPAIAYAADASVSAGDVVSQEESIIQEDAADPEFPETAAEEDQQVIIDNSEVITAINMARDDLAKTILFSAFLVCGCMAAFIIWRFKV